MADGLKLEIEVDDKEIKQISDPARAADIVVGGLRLAVEMGANIALGAVQDRMPFVTGNLRNSLGVRIFEETSPVPAVIGLVSASAPYAPAVEYGTPPHTVPLDALKYWAIRKFGLDEEWAEVMAVQVQRKIREHGTKGQYPFKRGFDKVRPEIEELFDVALVNIYERIAAL